MSRAHSGHITLSLHHPHINTSWYYLLAVWDITTCLEEYNQVELDITASCLIVSCHVYPLPRYACDCFPLWLCFPLFHPHPYPLYLLDPQLWQYGKTASGWSYCCVSFHIHMVVSSIQSWVLLLLLLASCLQDSLHEIIFDTPCTIYSEKLFWFCSLFDHVRALCTVPFHSTHLSCVTPILHWPWE